MKVTAQSSRSSPIIAAAIVIAGVLISASLFFTLGAATKAATSTTTEVSTSTTTVTVTEQDDGNGCSLPALYLSSVLNGTLSRDLAAYLNEPGYPALNYTQVLTSLDVTGGNLNSTYQGTISNPTFASTVRGHSWALMYWTPYVPGITPLNYNYPLNNGPLWTLPIGYKPTGVLFLLGAWNTDDTAFGTVFAAYSLQNSSVNVNFVPAGPYGCVEN